MASILHKNSILHDFHGISNCICHKFRKVYMNKCISLYHFAKITRYFLIFIESSIQTSLSYYLPATFNLARSIAKLPRFIKKTHTRVIVFTLIDPFVYPEKYSLLLPKGIFAGWKHPKNIQLNFENKAVLHTLLLQHTVHLATGKE